MSRAHAQDELIAVISHPNDPHADRVIQYLHGVGRGVALVDLSDLPDRATLTMDYLNNGKPHLEFSRTGEKALDFDQVCSVWWRRPQPPDPAAVTDPDVHLFTVNEWQEAINGLWQLLSVRWVNDPIRDEVASRKALQLRVAVELGLRVPRTLITSDPDKARSFIASQPRGGTIYKTFSCTHQVWRETRLVQEDDLALLDTVRLAPVIFQEYIPAEVDLRITIVDRQVFAAAIGTPGTDYPVDFRMSLGQASTAAVELPEEVVARLLQLMSRLGLVYGAIDMRRTSDGEYVFLEINTAGEFLFIEERTGQPITKALGDCLAAKPV